MGHNCLCGVPLGGSKWTLTSAVAIMSELKDNFVFFFQQGFMFYIVFRYEYRFMNTVMNTEMAELYCIQIHV